MGLSRVVRVTRPIDGGNGYASDGSRDRRNPASLPGDRPGDGSELGVLISVHFPIIR